MRQVPVDEAFRMDVAALAASMGDGVCSLFVQHTTCALTIVTNEAGIAEDLLSVLRGLVPQTSAYVHDSADHVRAHVLSALVGPSVSVPVRAGRLGLAYADTLRALMLSPLGRGRLCLGLLRDFLLKKPV